MNDVRGMECLGEYPSTGAVYSLEPQDPLIASSTPGSAAVRPAQKQYQAPDAMVRQSLDHLRQITRRGRPAQSLVTATAPVMGQNETRPPSPTLSWRRGQPSEQDQTQAVIDAIVGADPSAAARIGYVRPRPPPPSGTEPDPFKKKYCTYWIRTGECDYTQQGCLYKHEMPDREELMKIGFREIPRWWKERNAVKITMDPIALSSNREPSWMRRRIMEVDDEASDADSEDDEFGDGGPTRAVVPRGPVAVMQPRQRVPASASQRPNTPIDSKQAFQVRLDPKEINEAVVTAQTIMDQQRQALPKTSASAVADDLLTNYPALVPLPGSPQPQPQLVTPPPTPAKHVSARTETTTSPAPPFCKGAFLPAVDPPAQRAHTPSASPAPTSTRGPNPRMIPIAAAAAASPCASSAVHPAKDQQQHPPRTPAAISALIDSIPLPPGSPTKSTQRAPVTAAAEPAPVAALLPSLAEVSEEGSGAKSATTRPTAREVAVQRKSKPAIPPAARGLLASRHAPVSAAVGVAKERVTQPGMRSTVRSTESKGSAERTAAKGAERSEVRQRSEARSGERFRRGAVVVASAAAVAAGAASKEAAPKPRARRPAIPGSVFERSEAGKVVARNVRSSRL
ncbi:hypothetical protein W97_06945 [Coniosporium apollinis CBS 100218]|uniref:C3H1-type domain-containing protein n=1 Tax=Coniosporium apollinis (strain CBS 100218) TaxID=1168221 RepID=R7Z0A1_CONA1|nr:uncharacterized protein W97_06945 [Coniosporium apollinis CBS 100218]EON67577.1 hypothetical protein W97_06945 [Coniosporium apollinis CBS 100218]